MEKKEKAMDFSFDWLPGFKEMTACQEDSADALLPPERLQKEEQAYWKDFEYMIGQLPLVAREIFIVADAILDRYEFPASSMYAEYPDGVTMRRIADEIYEKLKYHETERTVQTGDGMAAPNPYFVEAEFRTANTPLRTLILVILYWNVGYRRQRYLRRQALFENK